MYTSLFSRFWLSMKLCNMFSHVYCLSVSVHTLVLLTFRALYSQWSVVLVWHIGQFLVVSSVVADEDVVAVAAVLVPWCRVDVDVDVDVDGRVVITSPTHVARTRSTEFSFFSFLSLSFTAVK